MFHNCRFERDLRSKARFAQSAYEHLFAKKAVHRLLHDYVQPEIMGQLMLSPKADPRVSVATRVGTKGGECVEPVTIIIKNNKYK